MYATPPALARCTGSAYSPYVHVVGYYGYLSKNTGFCQVCGIQVRKMFTPQAPYQQYWWIDAHLTLQEWP